MKQVWGANLTKNAKSSNFHCYLCGGNIVTDRSSPEMEHKLPCTYFYAKFPSIFRVFDDVLIEWISWVVTNWIYPDSHPLGIDTAGRLAWPAGTLCRILDKNRQIWSESGP